MSSALTIHQGFLGCAIAFLPCSCRGQARTSLGFHLPHVAYHIRIVQRVATVHQVILAHDLPDR